MQREHQEKQDVKQSREQEEDGFSSNGEVSAAKLTKKNSWQVQGDGCLTEKQRG